MGRFETDVTRRVWDNDNGTKIVIKPDCDALGLVEVDGGNDYGRLVMDPQMALQVAEALRITAIELGADQ